MTIIQNKRKFNQIFRDNRGSYIIEFAILALPLMTLLMGGIELGYLAYAKSNVEGALREVSRLAATGTATTADLDNLLNQKISNIKGATPEITIRSYTSFGAVGQPEPLVKDINGDGAVEDVGDCYTDINDNLQWDADRGADGTGWAEEVLYYGVTVNYPMIFGLTASVLNGGKSNMTITANTVIKNEPFSNITKPIPKDICICAGDEELVDGVCTSI